MQHKVAQVKPFSHLCRTRIAPFYSYDLGADNGPTQWFNA